MILKTFTLEAWDVQHWFFVSSVYFFVKLPFWEKAFGMKKSQHDLIYSKHLGDLTLVIFLNCSPIKKSVYKLEIPEVSEFWSLYENRTLGKLRNFFKTCTSCFVGGSWKFPRFLSFQFWPIYKNRKLRKLGNFFKICRCFAGGSWKFLRFLSFQFWPLCWNRKLGKLGNFFKTCKVKQICSV